MTEDAAAKKQRPDGRQVRWDAHKASRREVIIEAALAASEEAGAGVVVPLQDIAERAGVVRTVVYRHFHDRAELDHAMQQRALEMLRDAVTDSLLLEGTIAEIIDRVVMSYVQWAAAHPELHRIATEERVGGMRDMEMTIADIADRLEALLNLAIALLSVDLTTEDAQAMDPLVFGLVGQAFGTVRRWLRQPERQPDAIALGKFIARSVWFQIDGHARDRGIELDPNVDVAELFNLTDMFDALIESDGNTPAAD
ncbi:MAG: TetR/AcrR family transcriptional regulator [Marmoricola sp.]